MSRIRSPGVFLYASLFLAAVTNCFVLFPASNAPNDYPNNCVDALSRNITECSNAIPTLDPNGFYTESSLQRSCTSDCRSALQSWEQSIDDSCNGVTYTNDYGNTVPVSSVATMINFNFNQTCLINDGEYCNIVLGNLTKASVNGSSGQKDCNKCSLFKLRDTAKFQYGDGPLVYSKSLYQSYTSSCHFTGYPLTAKPTSVPISTTALSSSRLIGSKTSSASAGPTATCGGSKYHIKSGDTCNSISLSQGVATWQLLMDNDLPAYCAKFPKKGSLCIKNKCDVYTVQSGDTCTSVSAAHNISAVQLRSYNPWIDSGCYNFNRTIDSQICINEPGQKYVPPATTTSAAPSTASSAVPVPSDVAANTTTRCGEYYKVGKGEECDVFTTKFGISRDDFGILNPEINVNCTNLLANTSYCVQPVGDINSYPNAPGYTGPSSSISKVAYTSLPDATYAPIFEVTPLAPQTRQGCDAYASGADLQYDYDGVSQCDSASYFYDVTVANLILWNPSLQSTSTSSNSSTNLGDCSFSKQFRYCMDYPTPSATASVSGSRTSTPLSTATKH